MEQEVEQLKTLVNDLFAKIESLEERVSILEEEGASKPKGPEPILTCVQCLAEYKESENAEGHCKYHSQSVSYYGWECIYQCCNASAGDREEAMKLAGCTKGKHRSQHHTDYTYANYFFYMSDLSIEAKELWLTTELTDYVTECLEWAEVGLTAKGNVFVILGSNRIRPEAFAEFTPKELKKFKKSSLVALQKADPVGWSLKAELHATNSVVDSITVSIKPASSKTPLTKIIGIVFEGDSLRPGDVTTLSEAYPPKPSVTYTVPEDTHEGPVLEPGPDYSKDRKTDYPTETNDDTFAVQLQQVGSIEVGSSRTYGKESKWNNMFTVNVRASNGSPNIISITDYWGEYMNHDGEWVKVDEIYVGLKEKRDFFDTKDFLIDSVTPSNLIVRFCIAIADKKPNSLAERRKAHHSLPQPLHLQITFEDQEKRTASVRFEQGNRPLDLPTQQKREDSWNKKKPLPFYLFADNMDGRVRSDAAIFYNDDGILCYQPAANGDGGQYFYIRQSLMNIKAFKAKKAGEQEIELTKMRKEKKDPASTVAIFAMVDLDNQHVYALKVVITTPTSSATGYFLLQSEDFSESTISTDSDKVLVNSEFTVNWSVPCASKNDKIAVYPAFGKKYLSQAYNKQGELEGSTKIKAPGMPGEYELRYYPSFLQGSSTGARQDVYVATAKFSVETV